MVAYRRISNSTSPVLKNSMHLPQHHSAPTQLKINKILQRHVLSKRWTWHQVDLFASSVRPLCSDAACAQWDFPEKRT